MSYNDLTSISPGRIRSDNSWAVPDWPAHWQGRGNKQPQKSHGCISWCAVSWQEGCGVVWRSEVTLGSTPSGTSILLMCPSVTSACDVRVYHFATSLCVLHYFPLRGGDCKLQLKAIVSSTMKPWCKHRRENTTAEDKGSDKCQGPRGDLWAAPLMQSSLSSCSGGGLPVTMCGVRRHAQTVARRGYVSQDKVLYFLMFWCTEGLTHSMTHWADNIRWRRTLSRSHTSRIWLLSNVVSDAQAVTRSREKVTFFNHWWNKAAIFSRKACDRYHNFNLRYFTTPLITKTTFLSSFRTNSIKFKDPTPHRLKQGLRLIAVTTVNFYNES